VKPVILIRHASAGDRESWSGDDRLRPLDEKGWRQAEGLASALADYEIAQHSHLATPLIRGNPLASRPIPDHVA